MPDSQNDSPLQAIIAKAIEHAVALEQAKAQLDAWPDEHFAFEGISPFDDIDALFAPGETACDLHSAIIQRRDAIAVRNGAPELPAPTITEITFEEYQRERREELGRNSARVPFT